MVANLELALAMLKNIAGLVCPSNHEKIVDEQTTKKEIQPFAAAELEAVINVFRRSRKTEVEDMKRQVEIC